MLHGPFFWSWFRIVDRIVGARASIGGALTKTLLGQFVAFPIYLVAFFAVRNTLDGAPLAQTRADVADKLLPTVLAGTAVWVPANLINFSFVPLQHRVLFVNCVGLGWQAYMSRLVAARRPDSDHAVVPDHVATAY